MRSSAWQWGPRLLLSFCLCWSASSPSALALTSTPAAIHIGAFNLQVFGESKVAKPFIEDTLLSILSRYDIVLLEEIRDNDNKAVYRLLDDLNAKTHRGYQVIVSERLGRGEMKEQYAYFYDPSVVVVEENYTYPDAAEKFARPPFIARFSGQGRTFTLAGIHVAPLNVAGELQAMNDVYKDTESHFSDDNIIIMGDMNADCLYYKPKTQGFDYFEVKPHLMVADTEDTSVAPNQCAYDRAFGFGAIQKYTSDAHAYDFQADFKWTLADARQISDHFPIEFTITGTGSNADPVQVPPPPPSSASPGTAAPETMPAEPSTGTEAGSSSGDAVCGSDPYKTSSGYCYATFEGKKKRVSAACCPE